MNVIGLKRAIYGELARSDLLNDLHEDYIRIVAENAVPSTRNLIRTNDWLVYLYYAHLIRHFAPDPEARIVDWGGLYGHVTAILSALGYANSTNYLLHRSQAYSLFEKQFGLATLYGEHPNRLELDSGSVDVFISSGVLEHVREDGVGREDLILKEVGRVLKPGGLLAVWNFPAMLGTSELLAVAFGRWRHSFRYWGSDVKTPCRANGIGDAVFRPTQVPARQRDGTAGTPRRPRAPDARRRPTLAYSAFFALRPRFRRDCHETGRLRGRHDETGVSSGAGRGLTVGVIAEMLASIFSVCLRLACRGGPYAACPCRKPFVHERASRLCEHGRRLCLVDRAEENVIYLRTRV